MKTVASGLQDGANILKFFGGSRRKKVFLYLSPGKDEIKLLNKVKYLSLIGAKNLKLRRFCVICIWSGPVNHVYWFQFGLVLSLILCISQFQLRPAAPQADPRALAVVFALDSKFLGVGTLGEIMIKNI